MPVIGIEKLEPKSPVKSENHSKQSTMESGEESSTSEVFTRSPSKKKTFIKDARKPSTNKENKMDEDDWSDEDDNTKKVSGRSSKAKPQEKKKLKTTSSNAFMPEIKKARNNLDWCLVQSFESAEDFEKSDKFQDLK